jgi:hypothetical protein
MFNYLSTIFVRAYGLKSGKVELFTENYSYPETLIGGMSLFKFTKSAGKIAYLYHNF